MTVLWLAEFEDADALVRAAKAARARGVDDLDAFTPFPVSEVEHMRPSPSIPAWPWSVAAGLLFALATYALQVITNAVLYPIDVGGRPLHSWPAFLPATVAMGLLGAGLGAVLGLLVQARLPRLHHPLFELPVFARASVDRFFLGLRVSEGAEVDIGAVLAPETPVSLHRLEGRE